jgi:hypothetical protein
LSFLKLFFKTRNILFVQLELKNFSQKNFFVWVISKFFTIFFEWMFRKGEKTKGCFIFIHFLFNFFVFLIFFFLIFTDSFFTLDEIDHIYPQGSGGIVYRVKKEFSGEPFVLKCSAIPEDPPKPQNNQSKPIIPYKQRFEEVIACWKKAMNMSDYIVKYINHWYDDIQSYSYILMEYCPRGSLADEISKRKEENKKFSEKVSLYK